VRPLLRGEALEGLVRERETRVYPGSPPLWRVKPTPARLLLMIRGLDNKE
jgi:hypothetical protein